MSLPHPTGQTHRSAISRQDAQLHLRGAPLGVLGCDDQIAAVGGDAADANRIAIDRSDDRLGKFIEQVRDEFSPLRDALDKGLGRRVAVGACVFQIGTGRKRLAGRIASEDDASDRVVGFELGQPRGEPFVVILVPGVTTFGSTEHQDGNRAFALQEQWHFRVPR